MAPGYVDRAPPGMLPVCSVHFEPFQVSISSGPAPPCVSPTAIQLLEVVMQDTPVREAKPPFFGTGGAAVGVSDFPFQAKAYGRPVPAPASVMYVPTTTQAVADVQETAARLMRATVGFGVGTATERHAVPFHATTTWARLPDSLTFTATARQEFGVAHEILPLMMNAVPVVP
jgi:hypothetical protein